MTSEDCPLTDFIQTVSIVDFHNLECFVILKNNPTFILKCLSDHSDTAWIKINHKIKAMFVLSLEKVAGRRRRQMKGG